MVSEGLRHFSDLLVLELKDVEDFDIFSFLRRPFMLHSFCQKLLKFGLFFPQKCLDLL